MKHPYLQINEHILIQDLLVASIEGIQFCSTWALHKGNSFETNLAQIKNASMGEISINVPFSLYREMLLLSLKRGKETWICNKTTFLKRASEVVRRCTCNTVTKLTQLAFESFY